MTENGKHFEQQMTILQLIEGALPLRQPQFTRFLADMATALDRAMDPPNEEDEDEEDPEDYPDSPPW